MKKLVICALIAGLIQNLFCQPNNQNPIGKVEQKMIKKNKVKECFTLYYDLIDGKEVLRSDYDSSFYDESGNLIRTAWAFFTSTDFYREVAIYKYTGKNQIAEEKVYECYDKLIETTGETYLYNKKGFLIKSYYFKDGDILDDSCQYGYKKGRLISANVFGTELTCTYKNDSLFVHRSEDGTEDCYVKGHLVSHQSGSSRWTYEYDENGYFMGKKYYRENVLIDESVYEYKNGLVTKVTYHEFDRKTTSVEYYYYSYFE